MVCLEKMGMHEISVGNYVTSINGMVHPDRIMSEHDFLYILNGTWEKDDHGWWFANKGNPDYFTSTWAEYQGYSYYFGADGYLVTGWNYINNHWYRFNPEKGSHEGAMMTGWIYDPDYKGWFYTNPSGILVTGWNKIGGEWYYFNPESDGTLGLMAVNQVIDSYYVDSDGKMNEP